MYTQERGFPDGSAINNPPVNARDIGERNGNPVYYSCLGKSRRQRSLVGYSPYHLSKRLRDNRSNLAGMRQSAQQLSHVQLFETPWTATHPASLSITTSQSLLKLMSIESVMPSNHLILCHPLLLLPSVFPSIRK